MKHARGDGRASRQAPRAPARLSPAGRGPAHLGLVLVGLVYLGLGGCAWFQAPPVPNAVTPPPQHPAELVVESEPVTETAPDSLGMPDSSAVPVPDFAAAPDSQAAAPPVPEEWNLDGEKLSSVTGSGGDQVLDVIRPRITHGDLIITAAEGKYLVSSRVGRLNGEVTVTEGDLFARGDFATYDRNTEVLTANGNIEIQSDSLYVTGRRLVYVRPEGRARLDGGVEGWQGTRHLLADSMVWFREQKRIVLEGNARVENEEDDSWVTGDTIRYAMDGETAEVTGEPRLTMRSEAGVTTRIAGERLWIDPGSNARASGNVRVFRGLVTGYADSASFQRDLRTATLLGHPRVEEMNGTLHGDTLYLRFDDGEALERVDVEGNAHVRYAPVDTLRRGEVSIVEGRALSMFFLGEAAERVEVYGDAKSSYVPPAGDDSGTNVAKGDTITIFLKDVGVDRVQVRGKATGIYRFGGTPAGADSVSDSSFGIPPGADSLFAAAPGDSLPALGSPADADTGMTALDSLRVAGGPGGGPPGQERIEYTADEVTFVLDERTVELLGSATIDYGTLTLTAGKILFFADRRYLEAEDNPVLVDRSGGSENKIDGERMDYNVKDRVGTIDQGRTRTEDGFVYADRLREIAPDDFLAKQGNSTTCDNVDRGEAPHFHFTSKRMRIYLNDKVVAKPVTLYIRDIPVLALPFYVFSIRKGRHSGFLAPDFSFGLTGSSGQFIRNLGYYWAANDYTDYTFSLDYTQRPQRVVGNFTTRYAKRYLMDGSFALRQTLGSGERQHDITAAHAMTLGAWRLTGRGEFRDAGFRIDDPIGNDVSQRVDRILQSDLSASRSFGWGGSFSTSLSRREDLAPDPLDGADTEVLREALPNYRFSISSRTIGRAPDSQGEGGFLPFFANTRWNVSSSGGTTRTRRESTVIGTRTIDDSTSVADTTHGFVENRDSSARHTLSLSDARKVGPLNVGPSFNFTENWVDEEYSATDTVSGFFRAATWSAAVSGGTTAYGTLRGIGPVQALRHTLSPRVSFGYQPDFQGLTYYDPVANTTRNRYRGVSASKSSSLSLSVDNRFQGKFKSDDGSKRVDLLNWSVSTRYNLLADDNRWSTISSNMDIPQRILGVKMTFNSAHDPYEGFRFDSFQARGSYGLRGTLPGGGASESTASTGDAYGEPSDLRELGGDVYRDIGLASETAPSGGVLDWNAAFTFSYAGQRSLDEFETTASLNSSLNLRITKNWSITYANNWRITDGEVAGESFTLNRNLHCWDASFTGNRVGDDTTFWFRIRIRDLPEVKYEQGPRGDSGLQGLTGLLP